MGLLGLLSVGIWLSALGGVFIREIMTIAQSHWVVMLTHATTQTIAAEVGDQVSLGFHFLQVSEMTEVQSCVIHVAP